MTEFNFDCITQYSKEFQDITGEENMKGKYFCPFFSIITANRFLVGKDLNKFIHEGNIARSIMCHILYDKSSQMYFNELAEMTDLDKKDIIATTIDLVACNILGYEQIFPETETGKYAVIFLKNGKYFVVLVDNGKYYLRDCHEQTQYNLFTREEIIKHLNRAYQFDHEINIDGYSIEEYSNIEFIQIKTPFKIHFDFNVDYSVINKLENPKTSQHDIINSNSYYNEFDDIYENDKAIAEQLNKIEQEKNDFKEDEN